MQGWNMTTLHSQTKNLLKGLLFLLIFMGAALAEARPAQARSLKSQPNGSWGFNIVEPVGSPGEDSYLVSSIATQQQYVIHLNCQEGWTSGGQKLYAQEIQVFNVPKDMASLKSKHIGPHNDPDKFQQIDRMELRSTDACFQLRDECSFEKTHVLILTGNQNGKYKHQCTPKSRQQPGPRAAQPKSAT